MKKLFGFILIIGMLFGQEYSTQHIANQTYDKTDGSTVLANASFGIILKDN